MKHTIRYRRPLAPWVLERMTVPDTESGVAQLEAEAEERAIDPDPIELSATVLKTLQLPDVLALRPSLAAEITIFAALDSSTAIAGRVDALAHDRNGMTVAIDWKSDVAPTQATIGAHTAQLTDYCRAVGARRGALVYMTQGVVRWIAPEAA